MNTNREPCKGKCSLSCTTIRVLKEMVVSQERTDDPTRVLQIGQFYLFMCDKSESDVDNSKSDVDNSKSDIDNCTVTQPVKRELVRPPPPLNWMLPPCCRACRALFIYPAVDPLGTKSRMLASHCKGLTVKRIQGRSYPEVATAALKGLQVPPGYHCHPGQADSK